MIEADYWNKSDMKKLGSLLLFAILVLGVLGAVIKALVIALLILLIAGLIFRTRQTIMLLFIGCLMNLFDTHPLIVIALCIAIFCVVMTMANAAPPKGDVPRLPAPD